MEYKSGFVSIVGRPNVGKSTLMNNMVGEKIAIMSDKPQTTRNTIQAVYTDDQAQIVFLDTPGIHKIGKGDSMIIDNLRKAKVPVFLVINKVDKIANKEDIFDLIKMYDQEGVFKEIIPVSALKSSNIDSLIKAIKQTLDVGPKYFPDYMVTDQPERVLVAELIREKVLQYTNDEVPHGIAIEIEKMKARKDKDIVDVSAVIYCERNSHKGIIIGKNGRKLKGIGKSAREEIEFLLDTKVNLQLWVKVKENWRNLTNFITDFGLNENRD